MINSMTGFGKAAAGNKKISSEVEVKSVNSRFFEIYLKLPPALSAYEYEIREIVKSRVKRGKINVLINLKRNGMENEAVIIDETRLSNYIAFLNRIKRASGIKEEITLEHLLAGMEIWSAGEWKLSQADFSKVKDALIKALNNLNRMKLREGSVLKKDIISRLKKIEKQASVIEREFRKSVTEYFKKLKERVNDLVSNVEIEKDRLNLELALLADRADITEECVRLKSHIRFFRETLRNETEPGRKLNFLCQEMNRETNTISSKSLSTSIIHNAVLIKEEIEKVREQIQNIE